MHAERVCRLFREQIRKQHRAQVKRLAIHLVEVKDSSIVEFGFDVKRTWHRAALPKGRFLQLVELVAKRLGCLKEICCRPYVLTVIVLRLLRNLLQCLSVHFSSKSVCQLEIVDTLGKIAARRSCLPSLTWLIDKFSSTLTELHLPISAEVTGSIVKCHCLQKLTIEHLCLAEAVLMQLFTGMRELKVLRFGPRFGNLPGLSQALLSTSAQLEALSFKNIPFLHEYWSLVCQLPNHPLKTITRLGIHFSTATVADFEKIMDVCPNLNLIISDSFCVGHSHFSLDVA